uniref:RxLR effector candidate protein n=1 Tax=Peronospora matthiolae TaxID=2874970 RepID=A0AAV1UL01_9STRA
MRIVSLFALSASLSLLVAAGLAVSFDDPGILNAVAADVKASEPADALELAHSQIRQEQENRGLVPVVEAAEALVGHVIAPSNRVAESSKSALLKEQGELGRLVHGRQSVESDTSRGVINVHHEEDTRLSSDSQSIMSGKRAEVVATHQQGSVDPRFNNEEYKLACSLASKPHHRPSIDKYEKLARTIGPFATMLKLHERTAEPHSPEAHQENILEIAQFASWFLSKKDPELVREDARRADVSAEQRKIAEAVANGYDKFIVEAFRQARGYKLPRADNGKLGENPLFATITDSEFEAMRQMVQDDVTKGLFSYKPLLKSRGNIETQRQILQMKMTKGLEKEAATLQRQQFSEWIVKRIEPELARAQASSTCRSLPDLLSLYSVVDQYEQFVKKILEEVHGRKRKRDVPVYELD